MTMALNNYVGGEFVPAQRGQTIDNINPATGSVISTIPRSQEADVQAAVSAAVSAADVWRGCAVAERADALDAISAGIANRQEEFAVAESTDTGKPISVARTVDIPRAIENFRFFAGAIRHSSDDAHHMADAINYTVRRPVGVSGLITPWNLPLYLLSWKTAPALGMGNTIVAKPSEMTPTTATMLAEVIDSLSLPAGIFNLVHGLGAEAGAAIVEHPDVRAVSFTGGTETGAHVAASAAPHFKKLSLELGGKNATIVFADCDLDTAVAGALRAGFLNQGQVCLCGSRILVERPIYAQFVEKLVTMAKAMRLGDPADPETRLGSLISSSHRDKVASYVALAISEGGTVRCGGGSPGLPSPHDVGAFLQPTVITGLSPSCRTATEEIFGPVVTVHPFDDEAEAVSIANGVRFGLAASVWTRDLARAHRVSAVLDTGMVWVNTWLMRDLRVPFGGIKHSGVGREGGKYSLSFFSEARNICIKL